MPENSYESKRFELPLEASAGSFAAMAKARTVVLNWGPVLLWMLVIFFGSTDVLSSQRTSRFLGPFLRWLVPGISEPAIHRVQFVIRKAGHLTEYAILAALAWRALHRKDRGFRRWDWRKAAIAFVIAALYAVTDEWHQGFVGTRYASGLDVLIDSAGAVLGLALIKVWLAMRQNRN